MANFESFRWTISSSINFLFLKSVFLPKTPNAIVHCPLRFWPFQNASEPNYDLPRPEDQLGTQSFTYLKADLRQDIINGGFTALKILEFRSCTLSPENIFRFHTVE